MPLLLDTCTFWWLSNKQNRARLSEKAVSLIKDSADDLFISAISSFELGIKITKGRLQLAEKLTAEEWFREALKTHGVIQVPINFQIASQTTQLPPIHNDPCDRMIIATAQEYHMKILTPDKLISQYPQARCVW